MIFLVLAILLCVLLLVVTKRTASDSALPKSKIQAEYIIETAAGIIIVALARLRV